MISLILVKSLKFLTLSMPFFTLSIMLLALWGVGGKATYAEFNVGKSPSEVNSGQVKPVMMTDSKPGICDANTNTTQSVIENANGDSSVKKLIHEKIDWAKVV